MDLTNEDASNLKFLLWFAAINNCVKEIVGNTVESSAFWLAQADVVAFPPRTCAFRGQIVDSFDTHMELLRKSRVLNNPMPNRLRMSSFARLDVAELYVIHMHLK